MPDSQATLSFLEARILGVLIEKERTTPDAYPLTLNSLSAGCNQKSARDPVISATDSEVQSALEALRSRVLVLETYGAVSYTHLDVYKRQPSTSSTPLATRIFRKTPTAC